ncbi:MAG: copper amine oxidase N-terminal domain-containing protein [Oscillospiraceae bacterium]|jgi:hypothetical protein|nr:copper amine oxidase N-terminal domain-containing protein [Oscillospiraceae bacterium]
MPDTKKPKPTLLILLLLLLCTAFAIPVTAANQDVGFREIQVYVNRVNIKIDGELAAMTGEACILDNGDTVPFSILYNGTTYVPIRRLSELLLKQVSFDAATSTASIASIPPAKNGGEPFCPPPCRCDSTVD